MINNLEDIFDKNEKPCEEMTIQTRDMADGKVKPSKDIIISFLYTDRFYETVEYERSFGFESFWSGVGGFVGIFLGYSMMQVNWLLGN